MTISLDPMVSEIYMRMPSVRKAREHDCSHSPDDRPVPMSVEAIRKDSVNEMRNGVAGTIPVLAQRAASEGWGKSGQVPSLHAERAQ